jgi:hypothetical protein
MGYRIRPTVITFSSGVTPQALDLATGIAFNAGSDYWRIKWKGRLHESRSGTFGIFGNNSVSSATGFAVIFSTPTSDGSIGLSKGGSAAPGAASDTSYIKRDSSKDYVYEIEHLATGELFFRREGVVHQQGTYTSSNIFSAANQVLNSLFRRVAIPTSGVLDLELEYFEYQFQNNPTVRYSGDSIVAPSNKFPKDGGSGSDDLIQTATWPAGNAEWVYYDSGGVVKESTFTVSAAASVNMPGLKTSISSAGATGYFSVTTEGAKCAYASPSLGASTSILLTSTKIASSLASAAASVFFGLNYRKQGAQKVAVPGSGNVVLAANKCGVSTLSIPVAVEVGLYSGAMTNVEGTFTVSASAAFSFKSSKVAASSTQFVAVAAFAIASNKSGRSNAAVTAAATVAATAAKSSKATLSIAITSSVTINGQNLSAGEPEQWPVDVVFVSTNSRYQHVIASGSRFEYQITTHTRGGRSD